VVWCVVKVLKVVKADEEETVTMFARFSLGWISARPRRNSEQKIGRPGGKFLDILRGLINEKRNSYKICHSILVGATENSWESLVRVSPRLCPSTILAAIYDPINLEMSRPDFQ
jgi:hypothetical protein